MSFPIEWAKFVPKPRPLTGGDKHYVFLSYRSVNRAWVLNLLGLGIVGYKASDCARTGQAHTSWSWLIRIIFLKPWTEPPGGE
jgi:hypothetical protein